LRAIRAAILLALACALVRPGGTAQADCDYESQAANCGDGEPYNGYWWSYGGSLPTWVPGMVSIETWFLPAPLYAEGRAAYYAPHVMEATAEYRGLSLEGYVDGVSLMSPADIGLEVWLRPPGGEWEGPFLVVDCARKNDIWPIVAVRGELVEVGWRTAERWGMKGPLQDVQVSKWPPAALVAEPEDFREWWKERAEFTGRWDGGALYGGGSRWRVNGEWRTYAQPEPPPAVKEEPTAEPTPDERPLRVETNRSSLSVSPAETPEPQGGTPMFANVLTPEQLTVVGWVLGLIQLGKILWNLLRFKKPSATAIRIVVFVVAVPIAYIFAHVTAPVGISDPMALAEWVIGTAATVLLLTRLVYDNLLGGFLDWVDEKLITAVTSRVSFLKVLKLAP
jgi:hypothetical protein